MSDYSKSDALSALRSAGLAPGNVVFSHSNIGFFGKAAGANSSVDLCAQILDAILEVIGESGTLVVPTFTYSFCRRQIFDIDNSPSTCGAFTEYVRKQPGAQRSSDPIFSVAALGGQAQAMTRDVPEECFGADSFWDRFLKAKGLICNLNLDAGSTFLHFVEKQLGVPYRYDKLFTGTFCSGGKSSRRNAIFFCQDLSNADTVAAFETFHSLASERRLTKCSKLGRGQIVAIGAETSFNLVRDTIENRPFFLTSGGARGIVPSLKRPQKLIPVSIPPNASITEQIHCLWPVRCDIMSDGYDAALLAIARHTPMAIHGVDTGCRIGTQVVPEKWICHEGSLETVAGKRLLSYDDNPLHVAPYSVSFRGEISREALLSHLHTLPNQPDSIPYISKYSEGDWGLCCTERLRELLTAERYKVTIRSETTFGTLQIGEVTAPGAGSDVFLICVQLWHPSPSNDGFAGLMAGMQIMDALRQKPKLRHTYRLLILPPQFGYSAYLSRVSDQVASIKGALFINTIGSPDPFALELSQAGNTILDNSLTATFRQAVSAGRIGVYGSIVGDYDRQFNLPNVPVPVVALSRFTSMSDVAPAQPSPGRVEETAALVLRMIDRLET